MCVPFCMCMFTKHICKHTYANTITHTHSILPLRQICDVLKNTVQEMMERHGSARALVIDAAGVFVMCVFLCLCLYVMYGV